MEHASFAAVSPLGSVRSCQSGVTHRPIDLTGKTVAFIWNYIFRGEEIFLVIQQELEARFAGLRFVPFQRLGNIHGAEERAVLTALPDRLREFRVDAAVVGVGN